MGAPVGKYAVGSSVGIGVGSTVGAVGIPVGHGVGDGVADSSISSAAKVELLSGHIPGSPAEKMRDVATAPPELSIRILTVTGEPVRDAKARPPSDGMIASKSGTAPRPGNTIVQPRADSTVVRLPSMRSTSSSRNTFTLP